MIFAALALSACVPTVLSPPPATMVRKFSGIEVPGTYVSPTAYQSYLLARLAADAGHVGEAIELQRRAVAADSSSAYLRVQLAELYLRAGQLDPAREQAEAALELDPNNAEAFVIKSRVAIELDHGIVAEGLLQQATAIRPASDTAFAALIKFYVQRHDGAKALATTEKYVAAAPDSYDAHASFGQLLVDNDLNDRALAEYQLIVDRWPDQLEPRVTLSDLFAARDRLSEAIVQLEAVYRRAPSLPVAGLLVRRLVLADHGADAEAIADDAEFLVKRVIEWPTIAQMRLDTGQAEAALIALDPTLRAVEQKQLPSDEARLLAAQALVRLGRATEALSVLAAVRENAPERLTAVARRLDLLIHLGRCDEARQALGKLQLPRQTRLELDTKARECLGERAGALVMLSDELKRQPELEIELLFAEVLLRANEIETSLQQAILVRQAQPRNLRALIAEAEAQSRIGHASLALELAERASSQGPDSSSLASRLGMVFYEQKKYDAAERLLQRALRLEPEQASVLATLAEIQIARGDKHAALALVKQALQAGPDGALRARLEQHVLQLDPSRVGKTTTTPPRATGHQ